MANLLVNDCTPLAGRCKALDFILDKPSAPPRPSAPGAKCSADYEALCDRQRTLGAAERLDPLYWTPDGRGVAIARGGNSWVYPVDGGAARQLTRFTDARPIRAFAWSRDGKRLAIARSTVSNDIVLLERVK